MKRKARSGWWRPKAIEFFGRTVDVVSGSTSARGRAFLAGRWLQQPRRAAIVVFAVGLVLASLSTLWISRRNAKLVERRFDALAREAAELVSKRLRLYEYGLRGARGVVIGAGYRNIDRERFEQYAKSRDIDSEFPGAHGMGIIRRVPVSTERDFVASARRDGASNFAISQFSAHAGDRYIIQYIEPVARNHEALGLDIASEKRRRLAAINAMLSGNATLTAPITLVQATGKPLRSFLLLVPIYHPSFRLRNDEEREKATYGWSYAPLVIDEVLDGVSFDEGVSLTLRDASPAEPASFFELPDRSVLTGGPRRMIDLPIYGRTWRAEVRATPAFVAQLNMTRPRMVGIGGLIFTALLAGLAYVYVQSAQRELLVRAEQARLAAIV